MKHGHTKSNIITQTYNSWKAMKARCYQKNNSRYYNYGAKGITVCEEWKNSFATFVADMGERPQDCTLDRIDNAKGYLKENCKWSNKFEQARNHTKVINLHIDGETKTLAEWAAHFGIKYATVYVRYQKGYTLDLVFSNKSFLNKNHYNELLSSSL